MNLFTELKRRNVFRVAAAYAVVAWLLIQVGDVAADSLGFPAWFMPMLFVVLGLGFPIALLLSWAYEMTPDGVKRTEDVPEPESVTPRTGKRIDRLILIGALAVIAVLVIERVWFAGSGPDTAEGATVESSATAEPTATGQGDTEGGRLPKVTPATEKESIAVLPFANMSADPEQEFFADGITEDILTRLAAIGELRVISRTSIMRYKNSEKSLPEIAAELGVSHVLEGSVRRAGNQVRITGQLIRAADDAHLWAESFDRELADIFTVQTEIAGHIVEALALQLTEGERERLQHQGTDNAAAYENYLLGRGQLNRSYSDFAEIAALENEAEARFRSALEHDPDYADAWVGLARVALQRLGDDSQRDEAHYQTAVDAARRAVSLAPESAAGYVWLGRAYLARGLGEAATEQFRLAAEIEPDSVDVLSAQAGISRSEGRLAEAVRLLERAVRIEPGDANLRNGLAAAHSALGALPAARNAYQVAWGSITPHEARLNCQLADLALRAGEIDAVRDHMARMRELEPDSPFQANCSLQLILSVRDLDAARQVYEHQREYFEQRRPLLAATLLARTQPEADLEPLIARAERRLREELPRAWGSWLDYNLSQIELLRGDPETALAHLTRAVERGWRSYRELELDISWDPLREDPRFQALARQVDEDLARQRAELTAQARP